MEGRYFGRMPLEVGEIKMIRQGLLFSWKPGKKINTHFNIVTLVTIVEKTKKLFLSFFVSCIRLYQSVLLALKLFFFKKKKKVMSKYTLCPEQSLETV